MSLKSQASNRVKPVLRWPGGKTRLLKSILPKIPPHVCYCEPFAGGLAVLLSKERSPVEVINDLNGELVALYLNVQKHLPELLRQMESVITSRQLLHLFTKQPGLTEIERAMRFLIRNRVSFGGNMHSFGVCKTKGGGVAFGRKANMLLIEALHQRLDKVVIENIPYDRCFKNYDSKETFWFCDPPYLKSKIDAYQGWTEASVRQFRRELDKLKGQWLVTLDDSKFNREIFSDCKIEPGVTSNRAVNRRTHGAQTFGELIITP